MYRAEDKLILSPSDLNGFVECSHLTRLDLAYAHGERTHVPGADDPLAKLLAAKGIEHERSYLERLRAEDREVVEIADPDGRAVADLAAAAAATTDAMAAGAEVIYQATFLQPPGADSTNGAAFRGHADFLFRRDDRSSVFGRWSYEVADTKLARRAKPYFLLQLCFYSELLERAQGGEPPESVHVILGTGEHQTFRLAEFSAYFRRVRARFLASLGQEVATYPEPCAHCSVCRWKDRCDEKRAADDHLALVAGASRRHRDLLTAAGTITLEALGTLGPDAAVDGLRTEQLDKLRQQAALQLRTRSTGRPALALLEPEDGRGFARLPRPSGGDVFFDMEGDPFFDHGLEYLFGYVTCDAGAPEFTALWGRDRAEERLALEGFVDFVAERRTRWPDLHVYHYASYEVTALKRLAGMHGTREEELDQLLREGVFVDLYGVVREGMRIGQPSYGLKKVEAFYMDQRDTAVTDGNDSVIEFERWLEQGGMSGGDPEILHAIADYNRDDCVSTLELRDWLLERRIDAERMAGVELDWFERDAAERSEDAVALADETARLVAALVGALPEDMEDASDDERARWLLAQLLDYHRREARPVWWAFFSRKETDPTELVNDLECIGDLGPADPEQPPIADKKSLVHRMRFPVQETKMGARAEPCDSASGAAAGEIVAIDHEAGTLDLRRGPSLADVPLPRALIPSGPYRTFEQRGALRRLAAAVIADASAGGGGHYRACRDLLLRRPPRVRSVAAGEPLYEGSPTIERLRQVAADLDSSYLVVQGPPGSGKTYTGARLITHLIAQGKRVGVTANSHKAIHNLLEEVEEVAEDERLDYVGLKKASDDNPESRFESDHIASTSDNGSLTDAGVALPAGTSWHFCREEVDATLDYLFIDEAGQVSLADALALGTAARNIVLLGDPQQLPQVAQAAHPPGSSLSALEHVLAGRQTIPPEEGVFLDRTWRLHPDVSAYVSELMYEGRLRSAPGRERQRLVASGALGGTGIRWVPVEHEGNAQSSVEEAEAIAAMLRELAHARYVDCEGEEHELTLEDVLVVTPYNAQVKCLEQRLPAGARIGTVDKFQGQEAQAVFFSLATSSGADIPRGLEFLLSRNRLNVAVSRARCVAAVVGSAGLLEVDCRTIEQMRLVNAVCRVAEVGSVVRGPGFFSPGSLKGKVWSPSVTRPSAVRRPGRGSSGH